MFSSLILYPLEYKVDNRPNIANPDAIFVLACYYNTDLKGTEVSRWNECALQRLVESVRLYRLSKAPIIVTGGYFLKDEEVSYASQAKQFLTSLGIPADDIICIETGTDTQEEVKAVKAHNRHKKLWLVTSATHVRRAQALLDYRGIQSTAYPVDFLSSGQLTFLITFPSLHSIINVRRALYEYLARVKLTWSETAQ